MAKRHLGQNKPLILLVSAALIALVILFVAYTKLQSFSYSKLAPLSVELTLVNKVEQAVILEYDYGYGFNAGHSQVMPLAASAQPQSVDFTVSSWKKIRKLRVRTTDEKLLRLNAVSLQRAGSIVRMLGVPHIESAQNIVFLLESVDNAFKFEGGINADQ